MILNDYSLEAIAQLSIAFVLTTPPSTLVSLALARTPVASAILHPSVGQTACPAVPRKRQLHLLIMTTPHQTPSHMVFSPDTPLMPVQTTIVRWCN